MQTGQTVKPAKPKNRTSQIKSALANLAEEDVKLREPLFEAATAAARLALNPADRTLREAAAKAWTRLNSIMVMHLGKEERSVLPWVDSLGDYPHHMVERARKKHEQVMGLRATIATHSFEKGSDEEIAALARNLCVFATTLDDLIAGEQRELFPLMRRALFHRAPEPEAP
jgi:Hemerythrin HHE cation binding domain